MRAVRFWQKRAEKFNNLEWVNDKQYMDCFIRKACLKPDDIVLDVGTGTGKVADAAAVVAKQVIGVDISPHMLAQGNWGDNKAFVLWDIRKPLFQEEFFNKAFMRSVLHHITRGTKKALRQCLYALKPGSLFVISEGIPPSQDTVKYYKKIFRLKEKRILFTEKSLRRLVEKAGFEVIDESFHVLKQKSVRNWLENSCVPLKKQEKILSIYLKSDELKRAHNMRVMNNGCVDCLVDVKTVILTARKPLR